MDAFSFAFSSAHFVLAWTSLSSYLNGLPAWLSTSDSTACFSAMGGGDHLAQNWR
jgi:hypothetical protein